MSELTKLFEIPKVEPVVKRRERLAKPPRSDRKYVTVPFSEFFFMVRPDTFGGTISRTDPHCILYSLLSCLPEGAYIGGGYLTNLFGKLPNPGKDIDIFFRDEAAFNKTLALFSNPPLQNAVVVPSPVTMATDSTVGPWIYKAYFVVSSESRSYGIDPNNIIELRPWLAGLPAIQLVRICDYDNAEHVIDNFDFTVVQFAAYRQVGEPYSWDNQKVTYSVQGLKDLNDRVINIANLEHYIRANKRVEHYITKGFKPSERTIELIETEANRSIRSGLEWRWYDEGFTKIDYSSGHPVPVNEEGVSDSEGPICGCEVNEGPCCGVDGVVIDRERASAGFLRRATNYDVTRQKIDLRSFFAKTPVSETGEINALQENSNG